MDKVKSLGDNYSDDEHEADESFLNWEVFLSNQQNNGDSEEEESKMMVSHPPHNQIEDEHQQSQQHHEHQQINVPPNELLSVLRREEQLTEKDYDHAADEVDAEHDSDSESSSEQEEITKGPFFPFKNRETVIFASLFYGNHGITRRLGQKILDVIHTRGLRIDQVPRYMSTIRRAMLRLPQLRMYKTKVMQVVPRERKNRHQRPDSGSLWEHSEFATSNIPPQIKYIYLYVCLLQAVIQQVFTSPKFVDAGDGHQLFVFGTSNHDHTQEFTDVPLNTHYFKYRKFISFINNGEEYCIGDFIRIDRTPSLYRIDQLQSLPRPINELDQDLLIPELSIIATEFMRVDMFIREYDQRSLEGSLDKNYVEVVSSESAIIRPDSILEKKYILPISERPVASVRNPPRTFYCSHSYDHSTNIFTSYVPKPQSWTPAEWS